MPTALPFQDKISQKSSGSIEFRVDSVEYENGYSQRAKAGINNKVLYYNVVWNSLNVSEMTTLISALETNEGVDYFTWTPPGESSSLKFIINGPIPIVPLSGQYHTVTLPLKQVWDL